MKTIVGVYSDVALVCKPQAFKELHGVFWQIYNDEVRIVGLLRQKHFIDNYPLVFVQAEHIDLKPKKTKGGRK